MLSFQATGKELLELSRVRDLLFGIYAWEPRGDEAFRVEEAGSGILIAKEHGLTARHVMAAFAKFDPQFEARSRSSRGFFARPNKPREILRTRIHSAVYQENGRDECLPWWPRGGWQSEDTDISVVVMKPTTPASERRSQTLEYLEWQLIPPRVGARVCVYGFPEPKIDIQGNIRSGHVELWMRPAVVIEHAPVMRGHGFCEFPGFIVDQSLPPGMSGGAVLYNGRLSGIFTGPDFVSALWPLALMEYPMREDFFVAFAEHFDHEIIRTVDWAHVKGRVERRRCDRGDCLRNHVALNL
jgi:hypothetical protein